MKISYKLILAVAIASLTILGVFSYLLTRAQHRALISQVEHNAHQLSETIKSGTKHDMLLNQPDRLHRTIDTIGDQDGIDEVRIFNKEGSVIYSSDRAAVGGVVDMKAEACYGCHAADQPLERLSVKERSRIFSGPTGSRTLAIINPIYNEPNCSQAACHAHDADQTVLGVLDVTMSLAEVDAEMARSRRQIGLFALTAVAAVSLVIWVLVQTLVGKPVRRLVEATRTVAGGDLTSHIESHRKDELGHLAASFNQMTRQLAEVQQQLYHSEKLASIGRLAAGVAHEINNPLTGVLTFSSYLAKRLEDDPELRKDLETIVHETKRCRQIVKGLLDFSKQVPVRRTNVDLAEVIDRSVHIIENRLSLDHISLSKQVADDLPSITADPDQLLQVFINLLVNAADAIGDGGGEITIRADRRETDGRGEIEVVVADTGCGIPAEDVGKVFEPFYTTKDHEGTGLGLAVVWGIVDKHDGTVQLSSEVGVGTKVTIRLPVAPRVAAIAEEVA